MMRLILQREFVLIKQMHQMSVIFVIIATFKIKILNMNLRNGCRNLMQKSIKFNDVPIVSIKGSDYRIHFWYMSNYDAINIMNNSNLNEKSGLS